VSSRVSNLLSALGLVLVLILGGGYLLVGVLHINPTTPVTRISVDLSNSGGLRSGSDVVLRGVDIGKVDSVRSVNGGVRVSVSYKRKYKVPVDSALKVEGLSALGEPVFEISPKNSSGPYLENGTRLRTSPVNVPATIPELLSSSSDLLAQVDPKSVATISRALTQALTGLQDATPNILRGTTLLASTVVSRQPQLVRILANGRTMLGDAEWVGPSLRGLPEAFTSMSTVARTDLIRLFALARRTDGDALFNSLIPEENFLIDYVRKISPSVGAIASALLPLAKSTGSLLATVNFGDVIDQALHALPGDRVRIAVAIPH